LQPTKKNFKKKFSKKKKFQKKKISKFFLLTGGNRRCGCRRRCRSPETKVRELAEIESAAAAGAVPHGKPVGEGLPTKGCGGSRSERSELRENKRKPDIGSRGYRRCGCRRRCRSREPKVRKPGEIIGAAAAGAVGHGKPVGAGLPTKGCGGSRSERSELRENKRKPDIGSRGYRRCGCRRRCRSREPKVREPGEIVSAAAAGAVGHANDARNLPKITIVSLFFTGNRRGSCRRRCRSRK
jgi:hypothetical protein